MQLQLPELFAEIDRLQSRYGNPNYTALYGAGCINKPKIVFIFMNPTARNRSVDPSWQGIRYLGLV